MNKLVFTNFFQFIGSNLDNFTNISILFVVEIIAGSMVLYLMNAPKIIASISPYVPISTDLLGVVVAVAQRKLVLTRRHGYKRTI